MKINLKPEFETLWPDFKPWQSNDQTKQSQFKKKNDVDLKKKMQSWYKSENRQKQIRKQGLSWQKETKTRNCFSQQSSKSGFTHRNQKNSPDCQGSGWRSDL